MEELVQINLLVIIRAILQKDKVQLIMLLCQWSFSPKRWISIIIPLIEVCLMFIVLYVYSFHVINL